MKEAKGDYVWFVDADDYIVEDCLSDVVNFIYANHLDILKIEKERVNRDSHPYSESDFHLQPIGQSDTGATAINLIVRRDYLEKHKISFDTSLRYGEDTLWVFWVMFFKPRIKYVANAIYKYRIHPSSAMHTQRTSEKTKRQMDSAMGMTMTYDKALADYKHLLDENEVTHLINRRNWSTQNVLMYALISGKEARKEALKQLKEKGFYPYPILWNRLSVKFGLKNLVINLFCLPFPIKPLYHLLGRINDRIKLLR